MESKSDSLKKFWNEEMIKMKNISLAEMKTRVKKIKEKIYYLKKCNIRIYYKPEVINKVIFLEREEFENLLKNLESFEMILIEDKRLEKFQQSLWQIDIENNKMILISQNREVKKGVSLNIDLKNNNKLIITKKIF